MNFYGIKKIAGIILISGTALMLTSCLRVRVSNDKYEPVAQISQTDADSLLEEALPADGFEFRYRQIKNIDAGTYYIYDIAEDKVKMDQQLAVNSVSGEIMVYDPETDELSDFSSFAGYDERKDESIEWTGKYVSKEKGTVEIEEQDPGSFEYKISPKKGEKVSGFAYKENSVEAKSELEGVSIMFNLDGKELVIGGEETGTQYDGTYVRK